MAMYTNEELKEIREEHCPDLILVDQYILDKPERYFTEVMDKVQDSITRRGWHMVENMKVTLLTGERGILTLAQGGEYVMQSVNKNMADWVKSFTFKRKGWGIEFQVIHNEVLDDPVYSGFTDTHGFPLSDYNVMAISGDYPLFIMKIKEQ